MNRLQTFFFGVSRTARAVIAINLLGLVLLAAMLVVRAMTPSDGARVAPNASVWQADGVILSPWQPASLSASSGNPIRQGDKLVAVNGIPLATLVRGSITFQPAASPFQAGQTVTYTLINPSGRRDVPVRLHPFDFGAWLGDAWIVLLSCLVAQAVGTFVVLRRPEDRAARAALLWAPGLWASGALYSLGLHISDLYNPFAFWLYNIGSHAGYVLIFVSSVRFALEYTHPGGRTFRAFRRSGSIWLTFVIPYVFVTAYLIATWLNVRGSPTASPILWLGQWRFSTTLVGLAYILFAVGISIISYRNTRNAATRLKIRWVVFVGCLVSLLNLPLNIVPSLLQGGPLGSLNIIVPMFVLFDIAIAYSILRYRYMDIDVLIRRTVVYSAIAVVLGLVYVLALVLVGTVVLSADNLGALFGSSASSDAQLAADISIVLTTLLGVFTFNHLRYRLQMAVDRLFFRRRYNTEQAIAEFGAVMRREVDFDKLNEQLLDLVQDSVQPQHVALWTRPSGYDKIQAQSSMPRPAALTTARLDPS